MGLKKGWPFGWWLGLFLVAVVAVYLVLTRPWPWRSKPVSLPVVMEPQTPTVGVTPSGTSNSMVSARPTTIPSATGSDPASTTDPVTPTIPNRTFVVLCYHRFVVDPAKYKYLSEYRFPQADFRWQMQYLKDHGITPISMQQLEAYWFEGKPLPAKPVLLTFDDGFRSLYTVMFPVLKEFHYPGVLFLYTDFLRAHGASLRWSDIQAMKEYGMNLESHTKTHPNMGFDQEKMAPADFASFLALELSDPLEYIKKEWDYTPTTLAYPYGVYNPTILDEVRKLGYKLAFTVNPGPNDRTVPPLRLKRDLILGPMSHEAFADLFKLKVLHLGNIQPGDGEVLSTHRPLISMTIEDPINYKTLKLFLGNTPLTYRYNPKTHELQHQIVTNLRSGGFFLSAQARDLQGVKRVYTWYFRILHTGLKGDISPKKPMMTELDNK